MTRSTPESLVSWRQAWKSTAFRVHLVVTVAAVTAVAASAHLLFDFIEARSGPRLHDPLLDLLPSRDVSWIIFFFLYSGVVAGLYANLKKPLRLLLSFQAYVLVMLMRYTTLTLWPLDPPAGYMPLREPVVQLFFTSDGRIISRDLFFSGHMSTLLVLIFTVGPSLVRRMLVFFMVILAVLLLIQHVHYTIDILAAPPGAWLAYLLAKKITVRWTDPPLQS
jgi:hypothetical protein